MPIEKGSGGLKRLYLGNKLLVGGPCAPGKNPFAYFPFQDNILDVMGNIEMPSSNLTYSKGSVGYDITAPNGADGDFVIIFDEKPLFLKQWVKWKATGSHPRNYVKNNTMGFGCYTYTFKHWQSTYDNVREGPGHAAKKNLQMNTRYHICIQWINGTWKGYINGQPSDTMNYAYDPGMWNASWATPPNTGADKYGLGVIRLGTNEYAQVLLDMETRTDDEILKDFNNTKSAFGF